MQGIKGLIIRENICIQEEKVIWELYFSVQYFCKSATFEGINDFFQIIRLPIENPVATGMWIKEIKTRCVYLM